MFENKGKALIYIVLYRVLWHLWQQKHKNSCSVRTHARVREGLHVFLHFNFPLHHHLLAPTRKTTRQFTKNDTSFYRKRHVVLWKTIRRFMKNKPSFVLYVEERNVLLYHLGKVMRKDKNGDAAVCKILFSAGCYTCEAKTVFHPLRRRVRGSCYLQWMVSRFSSVVPCAI